ncbi:hypothetical protein QFZ87_001159 [Bacillus sp. SLBN-46]|nr:hypothetical protein [Bacillus sp. SLBN-46]
MSKKKEWTIACFLFLLFLNGFGILAVNLLGK